MSNILTNSLETKSYTLFLSSTDKVSISLSSYSSNYSAILT